MPTSTEPPTRPPAPHPAASTARATAGRAGLAGTPTLAGLRLLAQAVSGRPWEVRADALSDPRAYLTGNAIVVDQATLATAPDQVRTQVVVQAAMAAAGSFSPSVIRALVGRPRSASRYCALEATRAIRTLATVPTSVSRRVLATTDIPASDSPEQSRALALGRADLPTAPDFFGQIRPLRVLLDSAHAGSTGSHTELDTAREPPTEKPDSHDDEEGSEQSKLLKLLSSPVGGDNPIARMLRSVLGQSTGPAEDTASAASSPRNGGRVRPGRRHRGQITAGAVAAAVLPARGGTARYPEWDERGGRYRPDWVSVHDTDPWTPDGPRDLTTLNLRPGPRLRRSMLNGTLTPQPRGRAPQGEQLSPDGLVDLAHWLTHQRRPPGDATSGAAPLPFVDVRRTRPDVAVMVLLDASSSTGDHTHTGPPVFDQHLALAYRLTTACESIGLPAGLYAFQAWGRSLLRMLRVKTLHERLSAHTRNRLALLEPAGYTRMGGAIRHATYLLERSAPGMKRLLVLVSDGFPYDEDYEAAQASADTRRAILEARALGIGCVCVGVTAPTPDESRSRSDALASASALHVGDADRIEHRLGGLIRQALRDAHRRGDHNPTPPTVPA